MRIQGRRTRWSGRKLAHRDGEACQCDKSVKSPSSRRSGRTYVRNELATRGLAKTRMILCQLKVYLTTLQCWNRQLWQHSLLGVKFWKFSQLVRSLWRGFRAC